MPNNRCPNGCGDPCVDWHDWERCADCHAPFHYWRWNDLDHEAAKQHLGERIYICACLFWTGLHDHRLGQRLLSENPNWSAVCNYYSMVHCLRLFWFMLYGSYSTGHNSLARGLQSGGRGARADWSNDLLRRGETNLTSASFQAVLRDEFQDGAIADKVPLIGAMFERARVLRNDSNYESLILAHQYFHGGVEVNIPDEMARTADVMSQASRFVIQYTSQVIGLVFKNDRPWIGIESPYSGADLKALLLRYVYDKIRGANNGHEPDTTVLMEWFQGLPEILQAMTDAESNVDNPARELVACIGYSVFGAKRNLMREFRDKVRDLENALGRAIDGPAAELALFD